MKGKQGAQRTDWLDLTKQQSNTSCGGKKKGSSERYDDRLVGQTLTMEEEKQFEKKQHQTSQVQTNTHETHIRDATCSQNLAALTVQQTYGKNIHSQAGGARLVSTLSPAQTTSSNLFDDWV